MIYSYSELKGKIKVGDKVRAVEGVWNPCAKLYNFVEQKITDVRESGFTIDGCYHMFNRADGASLEIIETNQTTMNNEREEITWENLRAGDKVNDSYGYEHTILNIIAGLYFVSFGGVENGGASFFTLAGLKEDFTIVQPDKTKPPRKVTLAEIAEKFGEDVVIEG